MPRMKILDKPVRLSEISWEDLYDNLSYELEAKPNRDHTRRWRRLKRKLV